MSRNSATIQLSDKHRDELHASGITDSMIERAGVHTGNGELREKLGWMPAGLRTWGTALVIPFRDVDGRDTGYCRAKLDFPRIDESGARVKYESPHGEPNRIYIPPGFKESAATSDYTVETEGEKKALCGQSHGIPTIGLVGVYGWCRPRRKGKDGQPGGKKCLLPALTAIIKRGTKHKILFDSDAMKNPQVRTAAREFARAIMERGAAVAIVPLPAGDNGEKQGMDDFAVAKGAGALRELIQQTPDLTADDLAGDEVLLSNYAIRSEKCGDRTAFVRVARSLTQIGDSLAIATGGWPRRIGEALFVDDGGAHTVD